MKRSHRTTLLYAVLCVFCVSVEGAQNKGHSVKNDVPSQAVVLQGRHANSKASVASRFTKGIGLGSIHGKSRSVSGMLNSIDSKRVHDSLQNTVGKSLAGGRKHISNAISRLSKLSDAHSVPGLPIGTVSGGRLETATHKSLSSRGTSRNAKLGRRISSTGGISARSRGTLARAKGHRGSSRHRSSTSHTLRRGHLRQNGGISARRRSQHGSSKGRSRHVSGGSKHHGSSVHHTGISDAHGSPAAGANIVHGGSTRHLGILDSHGPSAVKSVHGGSAHILALSDIHNLSGIRTQHGRRRQTLRGLDAHHAHTAYDIHANAGTLQRGLSQNAGSGSGSGRLIIAPSSSNAASSTGVSDAHLIASILDQGNVGAHDLAALMPNFVAEEPQIFVDKQTAVRDAYPQIVVGRPEPLLAAPILPLALGSDGHVLTSSNTQIKQVLKSVLNTLSNSQSLSQQGIGTLLQTIRNTVNGPRKSLVLGSLGPKIELSPIIHAGSKAVSTENIIRIKESGKVSPIVLKTGGQLEISSGVNGAPTFKIYGFNPSRSSTDDKDKDNDDKKKN